MPTFLFDRVIFGPVVSRRLGVSLGINLLPVDRKWCNFDCLYCECGLNPEPGSVRDLLPSRDEVRLKLAEKIKEMAGSGKLPDVITFAGNGEPTLHPEFCGIIDDTLQIRNELCPGARIAVLSNSTTIHRAEIREALSHIDQNILKLDSALEDSFRKINRPAGKKRIADYEEALRLFGSGVIIQTLFVRGTYQGDAIDNTTEEELSALIAAYKKIAPEYVMIYSFERDTPVPTLEKIGREELEKIAQRIRENGIACEVSS
ncbi:MAG: radical SAM protein [Bacteroidota bacterium]